jgi:hypothetical protein
VGVGEGLNHAWGQTPGVIAAGSIVTSLDQLGAWYRAASLFVIPGKDETSLWVGELRRPVTAIVIRTEEVLMHCAEAFRRGRVWGPSSWEELADAPDGLDVLSAQGLVPSNDSATRDVLHQSSVDDLARNAPD